MAGTVIAASLVTGLNSDLPGFVIAQVTEHVYDTVSGRFLLIPQGSRLIGKYDNIVASGQERALVVWQRIILPDGSSIVIDNLPATDTGGYAGLADQVDLHTWKLLKGIAMATVLGVGSELAFGSSDSDLIKALQQSTQATTNRAGQRLIERQLNVQPTITVRPGWPLRVIVHKDILCGPTAAPRRTEERAKEGSRHARDRDVLRRQGRLRRHHPHAHPEHKVQLVANDRREADGAPDFRIMAGAAEIGAAWRRTRRESDETYLSVRLDDPALPQPIFGALIEDTANATARLIWRRDRKDDG